MDLAGFAQASFRRQSRCSNFKADAFAFNSAKVLEAGLEAIHRVRRTGDDDADALHGAALLEALGDDSSSQPSPPRQRVALRVDIRWSALLPRKVADRNLQASRTNQR